MRKWCISIGGSGQNRAVRNQYIMKSILFGIIINKAREVGGPVKATGNNEIRAHIIRSTTYQETGGGAVLDGEENRPNCFIAS